MGQRNYVPFINQCNLAIYPVTTQYIDWGFIAVITLECSGNLAYSKFDVSPYTQNEFYQAWDIYKNKSVALYNREVYY